MKNILLLGATGSIGDSVLSVIKQNNQQLNLFGIALNSNISKATSIIATLFIICSLALTIVSRGELTPNTSVIDKVEENTEDTPKIPENNN